MRRSPPTPGLARNAAPTNAPDGRRRPGTTASICRITIVSTALVAGIYGLAFGVLQHVPRIVPGLADVRDLPRLLQEQTISFVHFMQDLGGLIGRFALAFLVIAWFTRPRVVRVFQVPALVVIPLLLVSAPYLDLTVLACGVMLAGILLNGQLNFIGTYLPQVYPARLRGTGESFAVSVGADHRHVRFDDHTVARELHSRL